MRRNGNTYLSLSFLAILLPVLAYSLLPAPFPAKSASFGSITATVAVGICGNNIVEYGEDCDGSALDGQTCLSLGYDAGTLACGISCDFNVSECVNLGPDEGSAVFSGKAYPSSVVKILKDGQIAATTATDSSGDFETSLSHLIVGSYSFAVYAYDSIGNKSKTITYTRQISKNETEEISGIIVPPTLGADSDSVEKGETITFSGQSAPLAAITIYLVSSNSVWSLGAVSAGNGYYFHQLDTDSFETGSYSVSAKTSIGGLNSEFGEDVLFTIHDSDSDDADGGIDNNIEENEEGDDEISDAESSSAKGWKKVDFNDDSRVNLIDFSILIHWFDQPGHPAKVDVNNDNKVNLSDFSVMMYYWTG